MAQGGDYYKYKPLENYGADEEKEEDEEKEKDEEEEVNRTRPFDPPGATSTPRPGEEIQMQTMQDEKSGLPDTTSYAETSFGGDELVSIEHKSTLEKAYEFIQKSSQTCPLRPWAHYLLAILREMKILLFGLTKIQKRKEFSRKGAQILKKHFPQEFPDKFQKGFQKGFLKEFITQKASALNDSAEKSPY